MLSGSPGPGRMLELRLPGGDEHEHPSDVSRHPRTVARQASARRPFRPCPNSFFSQSIDPSPALGPFVPGVTTMTSAFKSTFDRVAAEVLGRRPKLELLVNQLRFVEPLAWRPGDTCCASDFPRRVPRISLPASPPPGTVPAPSPAAPAAACRPPALRQPRLAHQGGQLRSARNPRPAGPSACGSRRGRAAAGPPPPPGPRA